jgi:glyoxylase-like metal-dependent hydrolase (beta-lactamase superfamily II)
MLLACVSFAPRPSAAAETPPPRWCDLLPRPANAAMERVSVASDWYEVRRSAPGVFALMEPRQFQEVISYLIVGRDRALLFDSGLGLVPIGPVVAELTKLPVEVLNSHTHFDHVGGNAEFDRVLARDTPYTRANARGFPSQALEGEVAADAFCGNPPRGADLAHYRTRPWKATRMVAEGERIDLGGRVLEVLWAPGHTPDAVALLDRSNGLLWTGDSFYEGPIWLYAPESDLGAYERSMTRLAALVPGLKQVLPAHNTASADPKRLAQVVEAIRKVRAGSVAGTGKPDNQVVFAFDGFSILTSKRHLEGKGGAQDQGGSGLTTWP